MGAGAARFRTNILYSMNPLRIVWPTLISSISPRPSIPRVRKRIATDQVEEDSESASIADNPLSPSNSTLSFIPASTDAQLAPTPTPTPTPVPGSALDRFLSLCYTYRRPQLGYFGSLHPVIPNDSDDLTMCIP